MLVLGGLRILLKSYRFHAALALTLDVGSFSLLLMALLDSNAELDIKVS